MISQQMYVLYDKMGNPSSMEISPKFSLKDLDSSLKKFTLEITDLIYNYLDTTIVAKGKVFNIEEKENFGKNVNIFIGTGFSKIYRMKNENMKIGALRTNYYEESTDSFPVFELNNSRHAFAIIKDNTPSEQVFDCKFKLMPGNRYLIFALYNYEIEIIDLKSIFTCFLSVQQ